jgi:PLP dependent protein
VNTPDPQSIASRLRRVLERVETAATSVGRAPESVTVVAISKTFPPAAVRAAIEAGVTDVGENRAQELRDKAAAVGTGARWHFVGNLQMNKVRYVVGTAALVHSVDRSGLAETLARRARAIGITQKVLIEVNIAAEATKHGVEPGAALDLAEAIAALPGVSVKGLMAMPPLTDDPGESRGHFKELAALSGRLTAMLPGAGELSMGMSRDFEVAVEEGATIVRIGEAIFGPRAGGGK